MAARERVLSNNASFKEVIVMPAGCWIGSPEKESPRI